MANEILSFNLKNKRLGNNAAVTPPGATVPGAPTIGTATVGVGTMSVAFTAPASNGGSAITSYIATLSTGETSSGSSSPITFSGLSSVARTATVRAVNAVGQSSPSASSNSVTPTAEAWNTLMFGTQWNVINNIKESRTMTGYISRYSHYVGGKPLKTIRLYIPNFFLSSASTGLATNTGNDLPIVDASVEYAGTCYPVTFGGSRSTRIADGTGVWADDIVVQTTMGTASLPVNTRIDIKIKGLLDSTAHSVPGAAPRLTTADTGQQVVFYNPANVVMSSTDTAGIYTWTFQNGGTSGADIASRTSGLTPFVLGVHTAAPDVWLAFGDSITANTGDSGTNTSGTGYFQRAIGLMPVKAAAFNCSVHGSTALAGLTDTRITDLFNYCNLGYMLKGTNDFGAAGNGVTAQAMLDRANAFKAKCVAAGMSKVAIGKLPPRTTSTDSFATEENQTVVTGWDNSSAIPLVYNASLDTAGFDMVFPFDSVRGTTSVYKFKAGKSVDGTHLNQSGNIDGGTELQPLLSGLMTR